MKRILIIIAFISLYAIPYTLYPHYVLAANCDPNGGIDPSTWSLIEQYTCDPHNPGTAGQEWACFGDDGTPQAIKFSQDVSDANRCPIGQEGQSCTYQENCDVGGGLSSGQHSCTGTIQGGTCKYDSNVAPNCGECQPIQSPPPSVPPSPSTNPIPTAPSTEEQAVYNQCQLTSPDGVCKTSDKPTDGSFWHKLWDALTSLFLFPAQKPDQLTNQSAQLHQNNFPQDLQPNTSDTTQKVDQSLGTDNGYYTIDMPTFSESSVQGVTSTDPSPSADSSKDVANKEKLFEQANFPDNVHPITGTAATGQ